jgi:hypothetical protein
MYPKSPDAMTLKTAIKIIQASLKNPKRPHLQSINGTSVKGRVSAYKVYLTEQRLGSKNARFSINGVIQG